MIGVVGRPEDTQLVTEALSDAGLDSVVVPPDGTGETAFEAMVAVGETALIEVVADDLGVPVLPVTLDDGPHSVSPAAATEIMRAFTAGRATVQSNPLLAVEAGGTAAGTACLDVMLVRSEPGRISEYSVTAEQARSRFRADGVVVATPAGSHGYANAAGGPRLEDAAGAIAVVPVAAFGLGAPTWVVDAEVEVELRVVRDEGDVSLLLDGREERQLSGQSTVLVRSGGRFETIRLP